MTREPKKFVGLHGHDGNSIGDGFSPPEEHIKFCIKNGLDSHSFTNHGNMQSVAPAYLFNKKLKKDGQTFKVNYGNEFYFVPSLSDWRDAYALNKHEKELEKELKKKSSKEAKNKQLVVGDSYAPTKQEVLDFVEEKKESAEVVDDEASTIMENEEETKSVKALANKLFRRSHLVMIAKSSKGLQNLYKLTSHSVINGFYKFPRIDLDLIQQYAKGEIICSTACLGSEFFKVLGDNQQSYDYQTWEYESGEVYNTIMTKMEKLAWKFVEALGGDESNFYLELQVNKIPEQQIFNKYLMDLSKKTGIKCIVTADSHYSDPTHWRDREIYKLLGRMQQRSKGNVSAYDGLSAESLPKTIDELKCELYPKNASQMWESYQKYCKNGTHPLIYTGMDDFMCDAIERTHDIAHNIIQDVAPDTSIRLPSLTRILPSAPTAEELKGKDEDELAFEELKKISYIGLKEKKLDVKPEYVTRIEYELDVIHYLKISKYFLTYSKFMKAIAQGQLVGPARGSGAASLVCYLVDITSVDPVQYGLLFERFLTKYKSGFPDIDCLLPNTLVKTIEGYKSLSDIIVGENVVGLGGNTETVLAKNVRQITEEDNIIEITLQLNNVYGVVVATDKHRFFDLDKQEIYVRDLQIGSLLYSNLGNVVVVAIKRITTLVGHSIVDITTSGTKSFEIVPFDCIRDDEKIVSVYSYDVDVDKKTKTKKHNRRKSK